jgi:hypothetical protein
LTLSPELESLKNLALQTAPIDWAHAQGWKLRRASSTEMVGPCPRENAGDDRFSINTKTGAWHCRHCSVGGHDVIFLVQWSEGDLGFVKALERITGQRAADPIAPERAEELKRAAEAGEARRRAEAEKHRENARKAGVEIWRKGEKPRWAVSEPVVAYLEEARGIPVEALLEATGGAGPLLRQIRLHPWREKIPGPAGERDYWVTVAETPVMLGCVQLRDGRFGSVHQTWLDRSQPKGRLVLPPDAKGDERPTKKVLGAKKGGAIRLYTPPVVGAWLAAVGMNPTSSALRDFGPMRIVMGEGIESTLTPMAHAFEPNTAYWAGVDLGNMAGRARRDAQNRQIHDEPDLSDYFDPRSGEYRQPLGGPDCFLPPDWCSELVYLCDGDSVESHMMDKITRGLARAQALRQAAIDAGADLRPLAVN